MKIINCQFSCFRNLTEVEWIPCEGMNVICGENGQGKTNLLEGLWLLTGAKSFRTNKDSDLIQFGNKKAKIESSVFAQQIEKKIRLEIGEKTQAFLNEK